MAPVPLTKNQRIANEAEFVADIIEMLFKDRQRHLKLRKSRQGRTVSAQLQYLLNLAIANECRPSYLGTFGKALARRQYGGRVLTSRSLALLRTYCKATVLKSVIMQMCHVGERKLERILARAGMCAIDRLLVHHTPDALRIMSTTTLEQLVRKQTGDDAVNYATSELDRHRIEQEETGQWVARGDEDVPMENSDDVDQAMDDQTMDDQSQSDEEIEHGDPCNDDRSSNHSDSEDPGASTTVNTVAQVSADGKLLYKSTMQQRSAVAPRISRIGIVKPQKRPKITIKLARKHGIVRPPTPFEHERAPSPETPPASPTPFPAVQMDHPPTCPGAGQTTETNPQPAEPQAEPPPERSTEPETEAPAEPGEGGHQSELAHSGADVVPTFSGPLTRARKRTWYGTLVHPVADKPAREQTSTQLDESEASHERNVPNDAVHIASQVNTQETATEKTSNSEKLPQSWYYPDQTIREMLIPKVPPFNPNADGEKTRPIISPVSPVPFNTSQTPEPTVNNETSTVEKPHAGLKQSIIGHGVSAGWDDPSPKTIMSMISPAYSIPRTVTIDDDLLQTRESNRPNTQVDRGHQSNNNDELPNKRASSNNGALATEETPQPYFAMLAPLDISGSRKFVSTDPKRLQVRLLLLKKRLAEKLATSQTVGDQSPKGIICATETASKPNIE